MVSSHIHKTPRNALQTRHQLLTPTSTSNADTACNYSSSIFYPLFAYGTRFLQLDLGSGASSLVPPSSQSTNMPRQVISITSGSSKVDQSTPSFGSGVFSLMGHDGQFKQYSDMVGWVLGSLAAGAAGIRLAVCGDGGGMGERLHSAPSSFSAIPIIH